MSWWEHYRQFRGVAGEIGRQFADARVHGRAALVRAIGDARAGRPGRPWAVLAVYGVWAGLVLLLGGALGIERRVGREWFVLMVVATGLVMVRMMTQWGMFVREDRRPPAGVVGGWLRPAVLLGTAVWVGVRLGGLGASVSISSVLQVVFVACMQATFAVFGCMFAWVLLRWWRLGEDPGVKWRRPSTGNSHGR